MSQAQLIFERQWLHALLLATLLAGLAVVSGSDGVRSGQLWGVTTPVWFWLAIALAVGHQVYVWICWRTQLHGSLITRTLGTLGFPCMPRDSRFWAFASGVCSSSRFQIGTRCRRSPSSSSARDPALIPAVYLFYSVKRYFSFERAFGIDHFDASYRSLPFVRKGIFRFTRNGMYVYGFLLLWVPAFWFASLAALAVALFNHLYIWVHYFATELPDMKRIYGEARAAPRNGSA